MIKITVIESQRKVVAKMVGCEDDIYLRVKKNVPTYVTLNKELMKMPNFFKACAKCHPDDEFDVEVGTKLAIERVVAKYNACYHGYMATVAEDMEKILYKCN